MSRLPLLSLLVAAAVQAADPAWIGPKHLIDINPVALLQGEVSFEYERALAPWVSLMVGPTAMVFDGPVRVGNALNRGGALKSAAHFFPGGNALNGFWIGPEIVGGLGSFRGAELWGHGSWIEFDGSLGYTFIVADHLAFSLGAGAGWRFAAAHESGSDGVWITRHAQGLSLTGRFAIGYAF